MEENEDGGAEEDATPLRTGHVCGVESIGGGVIDGLHGVHWFLRLRRLLLVLLSVDFSAGGRVMNRSGMSLIPCLFRDQPYIFLDCMLVGWFRG